MDWVARLRGNEIHNPMSIEEEEGRTRSSSGIVSIPELLDKSCDGNRHKNNERPGSDDQDYHHESYGEYANDRTHELQQYLAVAAHVGLAAVVRLRATGLQLLLLGALRHGEIS